MHTHSLVLTISRRVDQNPFSPSAMIDLFFPPNTQQYLLPPSSAALSRRSHRFFHSFASGTGIWLGLARGFQGLCLFLRRRGFGS